MYQKKDDVDVKKEDACDRCRTVKHLYISWHRFEVCGECMDLNQDFITEYLLGEHEHLNKKSIQPERLSEKTSKEDAIV